MTKSDPILNQIAARFKKFDIEPTSGPDMAAYVERLYATPAPLLKRAIEMMARAQR